MSKVVSCALSAAIALTSSASALRAQTANANSAAPAVSGDWFFMPQVEQIPGTTKISVNPTSIATFNFALPYYLTLTSSLRTDWVHMDPGVAQSQYFGAKDLFLRYTPNENFLISAGTIPFWGPLGSEPALDKWEQIERGYLNLGFGGPNPGLIGLDAAGKFSLNGVDYKWQAITGTGDRYVQQSFMGTYFPDYCGKLNREACGLVAGADLIVTPFTGLDIHAQETNIANGAGFKNENRFSLGAQYQKPFGDVTVIGLVNANDVTNYWGGNQGLQSLTETLSVKKPVAGTPLTVEAYVSGTQARDAIMADYLYTGIKVTDQVNAKTTLTLSPYIGREDLSGKNASGVWAAVDIRF